MAEIRRRNGQQLILGILLQQCESFDDLTAAVENYGRELRNFSEIAPHALLREAYMRRIINECESAHPDGNIAVITGAFHTAGL